MQQVKIPLIQCILEKEGDGNHQMLNIISQIEKALEFGEKVKLDPEMDLKIYYGCGTTRQRGYVNIDVRNTKAADIVAELPALGVCLKGCCSEVYMSHVLEHFGSPGKAMRKGKTDVLGAILLVKAMLKDSGTIRIAVPNFKILCQMYIKGEVPLYPKLLGRISGEQEYPENLHKCVFDYEFLEYCLTYCGFEDIKNWDPIKEGFGSDSSADQVNGVSTSLNVQAKVCRKGLKKYLKI
jgi:predicted SAM-dependent methyltransferase